MPTEAELGTYYEKYYRFDYQLAATKPKEKHIAKRQREAFRRAQQLQGLLPEGARTLDFGAGSGEFVTLMLDKGFDAHGFEPGETYATHAMERLGSRMRQIGWQDAGYGPEFDLVTSFHVFEHLSTPLPALRRIASWLKPGGKVYLEVPDMAEWFRRKGFGSLHFAHVLGFNHHNLTLAAAKAGLRPIKVVAPTGIIFEQGVVEDEEPLAASGLLEARRQSARGAVGAYVSHQLSKLGRGLTGGARN
jgi:SAM-dependent methyltransferase